MNTTRPTTTFRDVSGDAPARTIRTATISRTLLLLCYHRYDEGQQVLERLEVRGLVGHQMLHSPSEMALLHLCFFIELHHKRPPGW